MNRLLHVPGLSPGAQVAWVQRHAQATPLLPGRRKDGEPPSPWKVLHSRLRAGQGTTPPAPGHLRAGQDPLPSCLPQQLPGP